jgi:glycosyltransferase involved in cell wall biosynthesis
MTRVIHLWTFASLVSLHKKPNISETLEQLKEKGLPARPNSTDKLTLANLMALQQVENDFEFIHLHSGNENFAEDFFATAIENDFIHLHVGPNAHSDFLVNFILENLQQLKDLRLRVVIGTEVTWKQKVDAGIFDEAKLVELMAFAYAVLGHTPKTHTYLYALDTESEMNFAEFPLGLLEAEPSATVDAVLESPKLLLGMILPQPGRVAKGEELHKQILELLDRDEIKKNWDVLVMNPPYTPQEFTDFAFGVDLMVNTSLGETFSYQIQEARALGTPVLHPTSTYMARRGEDFIECWPEFGLDFSNLDEIVSLLETFHESPQMLELESERQATLAREFFSLEALGNSFRKLYAQEPLGECQVIFSCGHRIDEAEEVQTNCCEKIHTIVLDQCSGSAPVDEVANRLQERFTKGHASDFDPKKNIVYRRTTHVKDGDGVWSTVSHDSVLGIVLDRVRVAARADPENPGLFERMLMRLAGSSRVGIYSCRLGFAVSSANWIKRRYSA